MAYRKNDMVTVRIEDTGSDGEGIGRKDGFILFIKDAVIGDVVEARIMKVKKTYAYARLERVVTPSPFRIEPRCPVHRQCGGCQLQPLSYEKQLEYKQNKVRNSLIRIGGFDAALVESLMEPAVGMKEPFHYRNKAQFPVAYNKEGKLITGFYAGRTHSIIANTDCALGAEENKVILESVLLYMEENGVTAYDEKTGTGLVRHILIRKGFHTGQLMVCLVVNGHGLPAAERLTEALKKIKGMTSVSISINKERTNVIMGKEVRTLWGSGCIRDTMRVCRTAPDRTGQEDEFVYTGDEVTFSISPLSFYQVNPFQTEKLYGLALEYAGLTGQETVWDLYCGIGTISLFLARSAKMVYGVEIVPEAITDARHNAELNGIGNAEFFVGRAEDVLPEQYERKGLYADVIVVDPPRKGCDEKCLATMLRMRPEKIVYVSCDPATLARDLKILCGGGYEMKRCRVVDQFGGTVHVETACLLVRKP